jgi:membrane protease YdiL (CAAX protease family)
MKPNIKRSILFISLTFVSSWLIAGLFYALGGKWNTPASLMVGVVYMFVPMIVAIVIRKVIYREELRQPLGISFKFNRWFIVAWLLPVIMTFAAFGIGLLLPGVEYSPEMSGLLDRFRSLLTPEKLQEIEHQIQSSPVNPIWIVLLQALIMGITINAVAGFGEEMGWRGFLQKELGYMGFWKPSLLIGFIWGVWHFPIILQGHNYPQHPIAGVFMMTAWCVLLGPIFSYIRLRAKSVIAAAIIHGSINASGGLAILLLRGGNDLTIGMTGLAGFIVVILANIALIVYDLFLAENSIMEDFSLINYN